MASGQGARRAEGGIVDQLIEGDLLKGAVAFAVRSQASQPPGLGTHIRSWDP